MKKEDNVQENKQINKVNAFKELIERLMINFKQGNNEFANLADNPYLFPQLKNFGN